MEDVDWFRLDVPRAGQLTVQTTGGTDTYGTLYGPGGQIGENDDDGEGYNFRIVMYVQPGTHYVEVRGFDSSVEGDYLLRAELSVAAPPPLTHTLPLMMPGSNMIQQGFVRILNLSDRAGTVRIDAIDDSGRRFGPATLSLNANQTRSFNSQDLEHGNPSKGLSGGVGDGEGNWWLEFRTELDVEPRAYIRTADGFLTSMHLRAAENMALGENGYLIPFFNPGSNLSLRSVLRLVNPGGGAAGIVISAWDDRGDRADDVTLTLAAGAARMLSAQALEQGDSGLSGRFGDGQGKWRLAVNSDRPVQVMSLMYTRSGNISNLSR